MKQYPHIPKGTGQSFCEFDAYVFDKLDGSNLRFEWSKKQGWHKFGTRHRLFDKTDPVFGCAIGLFAATLADNVEKICRDERLDRVVAFAEFWGPGSLGGHHDPLDQKRLTLFDVSVHRIGLLGPSDFIKMFGGCGDVAQLLGRFRWTRGFVERVWSGDIPGITFEGVVGKSGDGHSLVMAKAKTKAWIDAIHSRHGAAAQAIIDS